MIRSILALAVGGTLALAAPAVATPVTASGADPVDSLGGPSVDLEEVRSSFDADSGAWSVTVRLHGGPSDDPWAMINARLSGPSRDGEPCATELAGMRASTKPAGGNGAYLTTSVTGGVSRWPSGTKQVGPGEREVTLSVADPALAGLAVSCVSVNLSHNGVLDAIAPLRFPASGGRVAPPAHEVAPPPMPPRPATPGADGPAMPPTVVFAQSARRLRVARDGSVRVTVLPFAQRTTGRIVLRSLSGTVLGAGTVLDATAPDRLRQGRALALGAPHAASPGTAARAPRGDRARRLGWTAGAADAADDDPPLGRRPAQGVVDWRRMQRLQFDHVSPCRPTASSRTSPSTSTSARCSGRRSSVSGTATDGHRNGIGSVRSLRVPPVAFAPPFEETVTEFVPERARPLPITKGSPLRDHEGWMRFSPHPGGGTHVHYEISFRGVVPGVDRVVALGLKRNVARGLKTVDTKA
jgi:hypothetical protein